MDGFNGTVDFTKEEDVKMMKGFFILCQINKKRTLMLWSIWKMENQSL